MSGFGVVNHLLKRGKIAVGGETFGKALEHLVVDFVLGDKDVAIDVKATDRAAAHHFRGLTAFREDYRVRRAILVTLHPRPRETDGITVLPWRAFFERLWGGEIVRG